MHRALENGFPSRFDRGTESAPRPTWRPETELALIITGTGASLVLGLALVMAILYSDGMRDRASPTSAFNVSAAARRHLVEGVLGRRLHVEFPAPEEDQVEALAGERFQVTTYVDVRNEGFGGLVRVRYQVRLHRAPEGDWVIDGCGAP